jgi:prepilin-type N-terminal cleavage/methylation domain-containing protein
MILPTDHIPDQQSRIRTGFTLIELILVMAMLAAVFAVSAPSLSAFFKGRTLDSEARRFLSLSRLAQSQAVSQGVPMILWIDPEEGRYGLLADPGYFPPGYYQNDRGTNRVTFTLDDDIAVQFSPPLLSLQGMTSIPVQMGNEKGYIRFLPDGFIDESSPYQVLLQEDEERIVTIIQSANRLNYEIQNLQNPTRKG